MKPVNHVKDFSKLSILSMWRNKKTSGYYVIVGSAIDTTNATDGNILILYRSIAGDIVFSREVGEFLKKFDHVEVEDEQSESKITS